MEQLSLISGLPLVITRQVADSIETAVKAGIHNRNTFSIGKDVALSFFDQGDESNLDISDGIAVIKISGTLSKQVSFWASLYGRGCSYGWIREQAQAALDHTDVKAILLVFDSPGGGVDGVKETSDFLYRASQEKPVYVFADGCMCSGAEWLGSVGKEIAGTETVEVGSIGVRTLHIDYSGWNEKQSIKFTHLTAGKFKAMGNEDEPLNKEACEYINGHLNQIYQIFINDVARNSGKTTDEVSKMADGKVFIGQEALEIGLIDRIEESVETFIDYIIEQEGLKMDITEFKTKHPELYDSVTADAKASAKKEVETKITSSITAETERVLGIATAILGEETGKTISEVVNSGVDVKQINSLKSIGAFGISTRKEEEESADQSSRKDILAGLQSAHSQGVNQKSGEENKDGKSISDQVKDNLALIK